MYIVENKVSMNSGSEDLLLVIHFFNEKGKSLVNVLKSSIFPKIDFLTLEGLNKALSKGIIIGVSPTSHADLIKRRKIQNRSKDVTNLRNSNWPSLQPQVQEDRKVLKVQCKRFLVT
jgi:hypothetical protein